MKRKTDNFDKFFNRKSNSAIKEAFKQEKKAAKKERREAIDRHFEERRKAKEQAQAQPQTAKPGQPATHRPRPHPAQAGASHPASGEILPLNKYIAHGGICSRRDAAELIRQGKVQVNGQVVTEPGTKVAPTDTVKFNGKVVVMSRNFVYILLNKPKDYITTTDDPQGRKTVLDLIRQATTERVFPVGRLDRNTSGVLLLTNDGDLSQKLAHPKHEIKKIYHVTLDKAVTKADFDKIAAGVQLEDGLAFVDVIAYADARDKAQIGLEIHSGRNRIVRRIFEHLGYDVRGLDRVMYAGLTKKNVQRGKWRLLTEKEIRILKYLNTSYKGRPGGLSEKARLDKEVDALLNESPDNQAAFDEDEAPSASRPAKPAARKAGPATRRGPGSAHPAAGPRKSYGSGPKRPSAPDAAPGAKRSFTPRGAASGTSRPAKPGGRKSYDAAAESGAADRKPFGAAPRKGAAPGAGRPGKPAYRKGPGSAHPASGPKRPAAHGAGRPASAGPQRRPGANTGRPAKPGGASRRDAAPGAKRPAAAGPKQRPASAGPKRKPRPRY